MHSIAYNLELGQHMLPELEDYLLAQELFWPLSVQAPSGSPPYPRMTLGNLILVLDELQAQQAKMQSEQRHRHQSLQRGFQDGLKQWAVATEKKAAHEMRARFNLWKAYLQDLWRKGQRAGNYAYEVRNRVIFARLTPLAPESQDVAELRQWLLALDQQLMARFQDGDFLWDAALRSLYPRQDFPFLYGQPRLPDQA